MHPIRPMHRFRGGRLAAAFFALETLLVMRSNAQNVTLVTSNQQCGGTQGNCTDTGAGPCVDSQWPSFSCKNDTATYTCQRTSAAAWYCLVYPPNPLPPPTPRPPPGPPPPPPLTYIVLAGYQCGGLGGNCLQAGGSGGSCVDGPWTYYSCQDPSTCTRINQYAWNCVNPPAGAIAESGSSHADAIVGIVAGAVVGGIVLLVLIFYIWYRCTRYSVSLPEKPPKPKPPPPGPISTHPVAALRFTALDDQGLPILYRTNADEITAMSEAKYKEQYKRIAEKDDEKRRLLEASEHRHRLWAQFQAQKEQGSKKVSKKDPTTTWSKVTPIDSNQDSSGDSPGEKRTSKTIVLGVMAHGTRPAALAEPEDSQHLSYKTSMGGSREPSSFKSQWGQGSSQYPPLYYKDQPPYYAAGPPGYESSPDRHSNQLSPGGRTSNPRAIDLGSEHPSPPIADCDDPPFQAFNPDYIYQEGRSSDPYARRGGLVPPGIQRFGSQLGSPPGYVPDHLAFTSPPPPPPIFSSPAARHESWESVQLASNLRPLEVINAPSYEAFKPRASGGGGRVQSQSPERSILQNRSPQRGPIVILVKSDVQESRSPPSRLPDFDPLPIGNFVSSTAPDLELQSMDFTRVQRTSFVDRRSPGRISIHLPQPAPVSVQNEIPSTEAALRKATEDYMAAKELRRAEEERLAEKARQALKKAEEEKLLAEEEKLAAEAMRRAVKDKIAADALQRAQERMAAEALIQAEEERIAAESLQRAAEARRKAQEETLAAEALIRAEEERRQRSEEERLAAEALRRAEEERLAAEAFKRAEEQRRLAAEALRLAEEERQRAEEERLAEEERQRLAAIPKEPPPPFILVSAPPRSSGGGERPITQDHSRILENQLSSQKDLSHRADPEKQDSRSMSKFMTFSKSGRYTASADPVAEPMTAIGEEADEPFDENEPSLQEFKSRFLGGGGNGAVGGLTISSHQTVRYRRMENQKTRRQRPMSLEERRKTFRISPQLQAVPLPRDVLTLMRKLLAVLMADPEEIVYVINGYDAGNGYLEEEQLQDLIANVVEDASEDELALMNTAAVIYSACASKKEVLDGPAIAFIVEGFLKGREEEPAPARLLSAAAISSAASSSYLMNEEFSESSGLVSAGSMAGLEEAVLAAAAMARVGSMRSRPGSSGSVSLSRPQSAARPESRGLPIEPSMYHQKTMRFVRPEVIQEEGEELSPVGSYNPESGDDEMESPHASMKKRVGDPTRFANEAVKHKLHDQQLEQEDSSGSVF